MVPHLDLAPRFDFEKARASHVALREFIIGHPGGSADEAAVRTVQALCRRALDAADDSDCINAMARIEDLASRLFSAEGHRKWERAGQSGTAHLKLLILRELIVFRAHIASVEASRRHPELLGT